MKVLITLGPTQEPIDDIRYITNASSGKMGTALALEAMKRGYEVTLVHGPVNIWLPECKKIPVRTTQDMVDATLRELKSGYDVVISTAAISDYAPVRTKGKIRSGKTFSLNLRPTPKLIDRVRENYPKILLVGFKAEYGLGRDELRVRAREFLKNKRLNMVVANDIEKDAFGAEETEVIVAVGEVLREFGRASKRAIAGYIWNEIDLHTKKSGLL